eukprot:1084051_1
MFCRTFRVKHVASRCLSTLSISLRYPRYCIYVLRNTFSSDSDPKQNGHEHREEPKNQSLSSLFTNLFATNQHIDISDTDRNQKTNWIELYDKIKCTNYFELNIDPNDYHQSTYYKSISSRKYKWMDALILSDEPLTYHEFMCGAYHGMAFILQCLQQNDTDAIKACITADLSPWRKQTKLLIPWVYYILYDLVEFIRE